jgi:2-keto-4-pentenoate hydratase/2-oxohepta-3-ene-1,7-dioic acid hydratase in catechol pathway
VRLLTFVQENASYLGILHEKAIYELNSTSAFLLGEERRFPDNMISLLEGGDETFQRLRRLQNAIEKHKDNRNREGLAKSEDKIKLCAPIPHPRKNIVCLGVNYAEHANETRHDLPKLPIFFTKPPTSVIGPYDSIILPKSSSQIDYEAELAFVIGKEGKNITREKSWDHVAGYMVMNDVTARDLQRNHQQWYKGKGLDTFAPMGPQLVTREEVPDPGNLRIASYLNGNKMQDSNTRNLIFGIPSIISSLSADMTLEVGDIVATGTPSGIGHTRNPPVYLKPNDVVEVMVEQIGTIRNSVSSYV